MSNITLVSERTARKGARFTFLGPAEACENCNLQGICTALRVGARYEITGIRERKHDCPVFEGRAMVVQYRELPLEVVVESGKIVEGAVMTYTKKDCFHAGCEHYNECGGNSLPAGTRFKVNRMGKAIDCTVGYRMVEIEVELAD